MTENQAMAGLRALLNEQDYPRIERLGIPLETIAHQLALFKNPPPHMPLSRPCRIGDGIVKLTEDQVRVHASVGDSAAVCGRVMKFVPASGAASRMFKALYGAMNGGNAGSKPDPKAARDFMHNIARFAFSADLEQSLADSGLDAQALIRDEEYAVVLEHLLTPKGMNYDALPKGLLLFHRYRHGNRTAFEEHLVEAAGYCKQRGGRCRLHFTVAPEHQAAFERLLERVRPEYEGELNAHFEIGFSVQKPSTDTLAVDMENRPFRIQSGEILFRPGGHGALIENLSELGGDIVSIKNIDNVVPDRLKADTVLWKRVLIGMAAELEGHRNRLFEALGPDASDAAIAEVEAFLKGRFGADTHPASDADERIAFLKRLLDRPIRVCGVVENTGEPGGGPFWVKGPDRESGQIVESAQVAHDSDDQRAIFAQSTHFNPVDIVCAVRDPQGRPYDLRRFVDNDAVFIAKKSCEGRELKGLELPGLWNGGMADWNTVFVEVPISTFNPVKTVADLLRKAHCPSG